MPAIYSPASLRYKINWRAHRPQGDLRPKKKTHFMLAIQRPICRGLNVVIGVEKERFDFSADGTGVLQISARGTVFQSPLWMDRVPSKSGAEACGEAVHDHDPASAQDNALLPHVLPMVIQRASGITMWCSRPTSACAITIAWVGDRFLLEASWQPMQSVKAAPRRLASGRATCSCSARSESDGFDPGQACSGAAT